MSIWVLGWDGCWHLRAHLIRVAKPLVVVTSLACGGTAPATIAIPSPTPGPFHEIALPDAPNQLADYPASAFVPFSAPWGGVGGFAAPIPAAFAGSASGPFNFTFDDATPTFPYPNATPALPGALAPNPALVPASEPQHILVAFALSAFVYIFSRQVRSAVRIPETLERGDAPCQTTS